MVSIKDVTFATGVPIGAHPVEPLTLRSTMKPVSSVALSVHVSSIWLPLDDAAVRSMGAFGAAACRFETHSPNIGSSNRCLHTQQDRFSIRWYCTMVVFTSLGAKCTKCMSVSQYLSNYIVLQL